MRLFIAGKNSIAVDVLDYARNNFDIPISVILNKTENFKNSFQKSLGFYAKLWKIPIVTLEDAYVYTDALFLSLEFDQIIKPNLFNSNLLFNIHFSLLPAYKGMYTSALPLLQGKSYSGVTLHIIDSGIDTGDIIAQKKFDICKTDIARSLYLKYIEYGTKLVIEILPHLLSQNYEAFQQGSHGSTYYSKNAINYTNLKIEYRQTAFQIINQLRAFSFREYQLPIFNDYEIGKWKITEEKSILKPGTIVKEHLNSIQISTIDFDLILEFDPYQRLWNSCQSNDFCALEKILILPELNLETRTKEGWTALIIAVFNGAYECVLMLIDAGADVNSCNYNYTNVLMYAKTNALFSKNTRIIEKLIANKANIGAKDIFGKTVLDWAKEENDDLYKLLKVNYD